VVIYLRKIMQIHNKNYKYEGQSSQLTYISLFTHVCRYLFILYVYLCNYVLLDENKVHSFIQV
jgi:uncharacterized membrane protein YozB (DUF420 family)